MTKHEPSDVPEDERLFDTVLAEHWRSDAVADAVTRLGAASPAERSAAWGRASAADSSTRRLALHPHAWAIAAALVAVAVVTTMMVWRPAPAAAPAQESQDPGPGRQTHPRDLAHFLTLLQQVTAIHVGGMEAIGAVTTATASGVTDVLESTCWPETVRIDGEALAAWRRECEASANGAAAIGNSAAQFAVHFSLADGSTIEAMWGGGQPVVGGDWQLAPNEALQRLLEQAGEAATRLHRLASGKVLDLAELAALPTSMRRIESPWFDEKMAEALARFPQLETFVLAKGPVAFPAAGLRQLAAIKTLQSLDLRAADAAVGDLAPLADLPALTELSIRGAACSGMNVARVAPGLTMLTFEGATLGGASSFSLRSCKRLQALCLIDCAVSVGASLAELVLLPSLASLTIRQQEPVPGLAETLKIGKLRSLRLIDMPVTGAELAKLAELPTLREFAVLAPTLDDGAVLDLGALKQLTTLRLMNVKLSTDGLAELKQALPKCSIDCVPGRRVFDTASWLVR